MRDELVNSILTGDCFDVLTDLPDESVHAVVSDPPYGLAFMGRDWDDFEPKESTGKATVSTPTSKANGPPTSTRNPPPTPRNSGMDSRPA